MKHTKNNYIYLLIVFILASVPIFAEDSGMYNNPYSAPYYNMTIVSKSGFGADIFEPSFNPYSFVNITCGTPTQLDLIPYPIYADFDDDDIDELLMYCLGDSSNPENHFLLFDNTYTLIDSFNAEGYTGTGFTEITDDWYRPYDVEDIDGDDIPEIILFDVNDGSGSDTAVQVLVYGYNTTTKQIYDKNQIIVVNNSANFSISGYENISWVGTALYPQTNSQVLCEDNECFFWAGSNVFMLNMTDDTIISRNVLSSATLWDSSVSLIVESSLSDNFFPVGVVDYDKNGVDDYIFYNINNDSINILNSDDLVIDNYYTITFSGHLEHNWNFWECYDNNCPDDSYTMLLGSDGSNTAYCTLYDLSDGDLIQELELSVTSADGVQCWLDDTDGDGNQEICGMAYDISGNDGEWVCEEIATFFQSHNIEVSIDYEDTNFSSINTITDTNNDGILDFLGSWFIEYYPIINYTTWQLYSGFNNGGKFYSYARPFSDTSRYDVMMIPYRDVDVYYLYVDTGETPYFNFPVSFENYPYQQIANPVCENETIAFTCSYFDDCITDSENDAVYMMVDCQNDGDYEYISESASYFPLNDFDGCDTSGWNRTGLWNISFVVYDYNHTIEDNDTILIEVETTNSSICYDENNTGYIESSITNSPPFFTGLVVPDSQTPFCLNSSITFGCPLGSCYNDYQNDSVYFKVDCDGDNNYDITTLLGDTEFSCVFTESGNQSINVQVCDVYSSGVCDDTIYFFEVSEVTEIEVFETGELVCGSTNINSLIPSNLVNGVGEGCENDSDCKTNKCEYGFCAYKTTGQYCDFGYECLSQICTNHKCSKNSMVELIDSSVNQQFGSDSDTKNFIALTIMIIVVGAIIIGGKSLLSSVVGIMTFMVMAIFFTIIGWLSAWILFGLFIVIIIGGVIAVILGGGGG